MAEWTQRFEQHAVHKTLLAIRTALDNAEELVAESKDAAALEAHARVSHVHSVIARMLDSADPELVPPSIPDNINSQLQLVNQELQNFLSNKNPQHIRNAANNADAPLLQIGSLIVPSQSGDIDGLSDSISYFRRSVGQHLRYVDEDAKKADAQVKDVSKQLDEITAEIKSQKGRLDQAITTATEQFAKSEQERSSKWSTNVAQRQEQFAQEAKERAAEYKARFDKWESSLEEAATGQTNKFTEFLDTSGQSAHEVLSELQQLKTQAEELVNIIATTGMAGGYQSVADKEARRALWWHIGGALSIVGLVAFAIYAFIWTLQPEVTWSVFGARVFVALSFGLLAAYSERQANRHADTERLNRRWQLVLASIDPYLAGFPETKQHEIKQIVAERIFTASEASAKDPEPITTNALYDLFKMVLQNLSKK